MSATETRPILLSGRIGTLLWLVKEDDPPREMETMPSYTAAEYGPSSDASTERPNKPSLTNVERCQVRMAGAPQTLAALNGVVLAFIDWLHVSNVVAQMRRFCAFPALLVVRDRLLARRRGL